MPSTDQKRQIRRGLRFGIAAAMLSVSMLAGTAMLGLGGGTAEAITLSPLPVSQGSCNGSGPVSIAQASDTSSGSAESITVSGCDQATRGSESVWVNVDAGTQVVDSGIASVSPDTGGLPYPSGCIIPRVGNPGTCKGMTPYVVGGEWSLSLTVPAGCFSITSSNFDVVASQDYVHTSTSSVLVPDLVNETAIPLPPK
jgi:hypothetical protein